MRYQFNAQTRRLPESYDYGVGSFARPGAGIVGSTEQRLKFAQKTHRLPKNIMEYDRVCKTILLEGDADLIGVAVLQWPGSPDVLAEWDRLDESKEEISDGLPSKQKFGRDVYNLATDTTVAADDRIKAFRLFGEAQGFVGASRTQINNNIDARSIILVPRRSSRVDDPEREQKVIEAQARLVSDAVRKE